jgi:hypothetical protein
MIGIFGTVSVSAWMFPSSSVQAAPWCRWEPIPHSNEITCVPTGEWPRVMLNPQPLSPVSNWVMLNPQPLPPMSNWVMLNPQPLPPLFLDSSLFSNNTGIKISPQSDGSIIIITMNSTNTSNLNTTYSMNQP